ncbi:ImmA/IrrE family metallo-endopeptidase [Citrobacter freundii]|uniref:ImmA/IrrE family metallo-endopeptidase n=1 Tax=Enterobacteriaceae TaxID=543 RepID=UPI000A3B15D2|nr:MULTISPECIES: ImmA/IrrE family metallo-endopeptidase [Enterobacteriaceae]AWF38889.1 hypothetical protein CSC17_2385 [Klebsiella oxytoca]MDV1214597.1 ImmA/IrrE family metallo-endopeptidase [Citrobacter freundii]MDV1774438.1 ImmA/IrrE family metallo-endopeptidase [Citrobacter freundii]MEB0391027.1 ImmA/IrrE family metallo-endopeptidase [Citrobacter freundii]MEB0453030.1 ImmA/IrrE family metallo-endopeptidase [Citrobacter freundii]
MAFMTKKLKSSGVISGQDIDMTTASELIVFAKKNNIETSPLDVSRLTSLLGITMRLEPMKGEESGSLKQGKSGNWVMTVNSLHHPHRQRFTIAHEIGHFIRHTLNRNSFTDTVFFRNEETNKMEAEANRFAAELLMPENEFSKFIEEKSNQVADIAAHFQVSSMAVRIRAQQLGFSGHNL